MARGAVQGYRAAEGRGINNIVAATSGEPGGLDAQELVRTQAGKDAIGEREVGVGTVDDLVAAGAAVKRVTAAPAGKGIVAAVPEDQVITSRAQKGIVTGTTAQLGRLANVNDRDPVVAVPGIDKDL